MKTGVLLTNTGTPDAPDAKSVRRYLREFLSDKRVVKIPRVIWLPILHGLILPFRSRKSAALYENIWTSEGAPMRNSMHKLRDLLQEQLQTDFCIEVGMNYGNPSMQTALEKLRAHNIDQLIVLPLFPQYSNSTTASSFDRVTQQIKQWPALPPFNFIHNYADNPQYIKTLAQSAIQFWNLHHKPEHLLISFHGLPKRFVDAGDPYAQQCDTTARLLAESLDLNPEQWTLSYQSQFGYDKWLQPSTQQLLTALPNRGIQHLDVICPGFSMDCLETLEEIAMRGEEAFLEAGGKRLRLIPALNESSGHMELLKNIILQNIIK